MARTPELTPGQSVRVAHTARIVEQVEQNPYWYVVEYSDGTQEVVSLARITPIYDRVKATIDLDGSVYLQSNRLSLSGARDLLLWLEGNLAAIEEMEQHGIPPIAPPAPESLAPELFKHDHLCICPGCNQEPPDSR